MMRFTDIVSLSFLNLRLHKTRSLLTSLGVIFGVGSVISMMAISKGAERSALSQIESMGIDKIIIYTKKPHFDTSGGSSSGRGAATSSVEDYGLDVRDYQFIHTMENVHHITTIRNTRQPITKGETRLDLKLCGDVRALVQRDRFPGALDHLRDRAEREAQALPAGRDGRGRIEHPHPVRVLPHCRRDLQR